MANELIIVLFALVGGAVGYVLTVTNNNYFSIIDNPIIYSLGDYINVSELNAVIGGIIGLVLGLIVYLL
jgi:ABC-type lipoprotein release transport system permease subunit